MDSRAGRIIKLLRIFRIVRFIRLINILVVISMDDRKVENLPLILKNEKANHELSDESENESHVGTAMTELTNRRIIVLVLTIYIIIPLLTIYETDYSLSLATQLIHQMGVLNQTDSSMYKVQSRIFQFVYH